MKPHTASEQPRDYPQPPTRQSERDLLIELRTMLHTMQEQHVRDHAALNQRLQDYINSNNQRQNDLSGRVTAVEKRQFGLANRAAPIGGGIGGGALVTVFIELFKMMR